MKRLSYDLEDEQFKELRNHMRLDHPNIVRVVGYCDETQHKQVNYEGKFVVAEVRHRALCLEQWESSEASFWLVRTTTQ